MMKLVLVGLICLCGFLHALPAADQEKEQLVDGLLEILSARQLQEADEAQVLDAREEDSNMSDETYQFLESLKRQVDEHLQKKYNYGPHPYGCNGRRCGNAGTINSGKGSNSGHVNFGHTNGGGNTFSIGK